MFDSLFLRFSARSARGGLMRNNSFSSVLSRKLFAAAIIMGIIARIIPVPTALAADRSTPVGNSQSRARSVPEYDRAMKQALFCLDSGKSSLAFHRDLLTNLPSYTEILLLLPSERVDSVTRELQDAPFRDRIRLVPFEGNSEDHGILHFIDQAGKRLIREKITSAIPLQFGTLWSQDLFKPVAFPGGGLRLIAAPVHLCFWTESPVALSYPVSDNRYLSALSPLGLEVRRIPVAFKGGNVLIARAGNRTYAFCGSDILFETREVRLSFPSMVTADSLLAGSIAGALGVNTAVFVGGNHPQPRLMYHLDQAMLPLSDGVIAVTRFTGAYPGEPKENAALEEADAFLEQLRGALKNLGFTVQDMDTPARSALRSNFFVNAIPFTDAVTGRRTLLLPVFGDPEEAEAVRVNTRRLSALGYTVVPVPCRAGSLKGGIHCLINVLK